MKPKITSFIFSEDTEQAINHGTKGNVLHIVNPLHIIRPQFIPSGYTFSVTFGVKGLDPDSEHKIRFRLLTPSGSSAMDTNDISLPKNTGFDRLLPLELNGLMINLDFRNVALREIGEYKGVVLVNDEVIGDYPLDVYPEESINATT